jgi:SAM-dependent methyltransferase
VKIDSFISESESLSSSDVTLIGIDLSCSMIEIAKNRSIFVNKTRFVVNDIQNIDEFATQNSLDGIMSYFVLHHLSFADVEATFSNWHDKLRDNARLLIGVWTTEKEDDKPAPIEYPESLKMSANLYSKADVVGALERCGFVVEQSAIEEEPDMGMNMLFVEAFKTTIKRNQ